MHAIDRADRSVGKLLRLTADRQPDRPFIHCAGRSWSYGSFNASANRFAHFLADLGLRAGDKLAIMLPNSPEFLFAWLGAAKANIAYVPINTEYRGAILAHQLNLADVHTMVIGSQFLDRLADVAAQLPKLKQLIVHGAGGTPIATIAPIATVTRHDFAAFAAHGDREPDIAYRHDDAFAISYTSGTTGPSKGALTTNCHVLTFALDFVKLTEFTPDDRLYTCMPLFHAVASWLGVLATLSVGAQCLVVERFSPSRYFDDVRGFGATIGHTIFSMVPLLLKQPERPDDAKTSLRCVYLAQRNKVFEERFNCKIHEVYGQSETGIVTCAWPGETAPPGSCGHANTETYDVRVVDDADNEVAPNTVGEFVVRPKEPFNMMNGYYNMPQQTVEAFRNLWFHTGDNARMDEDGYFYFVDRKKDALRRRGENISSFELESVVHQHDKVLECAAIAVPSPLGEDDVKIVVVLRPGQQLTPQELWAHCEKNMPRFWIPRYIEFRDKLPRTPTEKVEKYRLRNGEQAGITYDREEVGRRAETA